MRRWKPGVLLCRFSRFASLTMPQLPASSITGSQVSGDGCGAWPSGACCASVGMDGGRTSHASSEVGTARSSSSAPPALKPRMATVAQHGSTSLPVHKFGCVCRKSTQCALSCVRLHLVLVAVALFWLGEVCRATCGDGVRGPVEENNAVLAKCIQTGREYQWEIPCRLALLQECDDGNSFGGDGCSASCQIERRVLQFASSRTSSRGFNF